MWQFEACQFRESSFGLQTSKGSYDCDFDEHAMFTKISGDWYVGVELVGFPIFDHLDCFHVLGKGFCAHRDWLCLVKIP